MAKLRKQLSLPGLLSCIRKQFRRIPDPAAAHSKITLTDSLMSGLALFSLKYPSLLKFDQDRASEIIQQNLRSLFGIQQTPCDTHLRERLDEVSPNLLRRAFTSLFAQVQRGNKLTPFQFLEGHYLLSVDGTGTCQPQMDSKFQDSIDFSSSLT